MTTHQQTVVNQLRQEYSTVSVLPVGQAVLVNCFPFGRPSKTFRISPSGFCQDVTKEPA